MNESRAWRKQYPFTLAFGLTIHKAQGMTLDRVEVDCRDIFRPGQLGVALSRTRRPEGLRVINFHPRYALKPAKKVTDFMDQIPKETLTDKSCCHIKIRQEGPMLTGDQGDDEDYTQEQPMMTDPTVEER
ncbi:ATP-dependent DNA helicase PIF1-like [Dreissena polymorpha]|uniref:ATP-dependent DNA helicase PIF1-like n=1 Tax=Dreissena polymorpha TaxID=45954 RepID=UPI00226503FD|nr:ATP-dependent DNA helicase PIF1-like [Dreissena polymorpha]